MSAGNSPFPPRATLTSLSLDVLALIGQHLDKTSLIELSRVSRSFTSLASDHRLWRHLSLSLSPYYGVHPLIPHTPADTTAEGGRYLAWARREAERAWKRHEVALREKIKTIILRADARRWSLVEKVTMKARSGTLHHTLLVLDYVSPNLRSLAIEDSAGNPYQDDDDTGEVAQSCLLGINDSDLHLAFPFLTHLHVRLSRAGSHFLRNIVVSSPNLDTLEVAISCPVNAPADEYHHRSRGAWSSHEPTKIRRLRYSWFDGGEMENRPASMMLVGILQHSPKLEQANIRYSFRYDGFLWSEIQDAVGRQESLQNLRWPEASLDARGRVGFSALRRLVLKCGDWLDWFGDLQEMPKLEVLHLDFRSRDKFHQDTWPDSCASPAKFSRLARAIRLYPHLHSMYTPSPTLRLGDVEIFRRLEEAERATTPPVAITSIRYGGDELLRITFTRDIEMVADTVTIEEASLYASPEYDIVERQLVSLEGPRRRCNVFRWLAQPIMVSLADYRGLVVPPEVIREMREVDGAGVQDWDRRGVEVGEMAWAVLERWYDQVARLLEEEEG